MDCFKKKGYLLYIIFSKQTMLEVTNLSVNAPVLGSMNSMCIVIQMNSFSKFALPIKYDISIDAVALSF